MPTPGASQRVLIVLAAALLGLGVVRFGWSGRPSVLSVADDPSLAVQLDLNLATTLDLETLPGVGAALAGRIVAYRTARGPFRSVEDLQKVPGLGRKLVGMLRPWLMVTPPDLRHGADPGRRFDRGGLPTGRD